MKRLLLLLLLHAAPASAQIYALDSVNEGGSSKVIATYTDGARHPITPSAVTIEVTEKSTHQFLCTYTLAQPPTSAVVSIPLGPACHRNATEQTLRERHHVLVVGMVDGEPVPSQGEYDVIDIAGRVVDGTGALVTPTINATPTRTVPPYGGPK